MTESERRRLIEEHLPLVKIIALKIVSRLPAGIELNDLIHSGVIGLIDAASRFDPAKGVKFATYASVRVRGAILDELRDLDWASRSLRQKIKEVEGAMLILEGKLGRPPQEEEVAESLNMDSTEYRHLLDEAKGMQTGVYRIAEGGEGNVGDDQAIAYYADETDRSPVMVLERGEMKRLLARMIDALPERERMVLGLYYQDDLNQKEIAAILGLTESRVSQIRSSAILRLRAKIAGIAGAHRVGNRSVL